MALLNQIGHNKQRISEQLMRLDAQRTKLSNQLDELEIAERAFKRFGGKGVPAEQPRKGVWGKLRRRPCSAQAARQPTGAGGIAG